MRIGSFSLCNPSVSCCVSVGARFHCSAVFRVGEGDGTPLQCSCLENPRDGGAWWAAVYGVAEGRTRLTRRSSSSSFPCTCCHSLLTVLKLKNILLVSSLGALMSKPSVYICVQGLCEHVLCPSFVWTRVRVSGISGREWGCWVLRSSVCVFPECWLHHLTSPAAICSHFCALLPGFGGVAGFVY